MIASSTQTARTPEAPRKAPGFEYVRLGNGDPTGRCIYCLGTAQQAEPLREALADFPCTVILAFVRDWDNQLTPWPAKGLYRGDADFQGNAPMTLSTLVDAFIPAVEEQEGLVPRARSIAGYSLAGLFSTYAFANGNQFDSMASMSGSFWYEDWVDYLLTLSPNKQGCFAYFSLGDREANARPAILHTVKTNTDATASIVQSWGATVENRMERGGHLDHMLERVQAGFNALAAR